MADVRCVFNTETETYHRLWISTRPGGPTAGVLNRVYDSELAAGFLAGILSSIALSALGLLTSSLSVSAAAAGGLVLLARLLVSRLASSSSHSVVPESDSPPDDARPDHISIAPDHITIVQTYCLGSSTFWRR
jgi:hypothetical protein